MSSWQLTQKRDLKKYSIPQDYHKDKFVKIRVIKTSISQKEALIYNAENPLTTYPVVFGTSGVGIVSEDYESENQTVVKGTRVFINSYAPCGQCMNCKNENSDLCQSPILLGINQDGCMSDFAVIPKSNVYAIPENVEDNDCLFLEYISIAINTIQKLSVDKGEFILIFGASILGNILAQIALYYQLIPIIIDNDEEALGLASENGIYYAIKNDEQLGEQLTQITSGMNAKYTVFTTNTKLELEDAFKYTNFAGKIILPGFDCFKTTGDISIAWSKQLSLSFISNGYSYTKRAINLLAQKVINTQNLIERSITFDYVPDALYKISTQVIKLTPSMKIVVDIKKGN